MKKICLIIIVLITVLLSFSVSYGGNINGAEASIISAASGTFEYEGNVYVSTSDSLNSLRGYLSRDDIDLTEEQAQEAISTMYANVQVGVEDGYIIKKGTKEPRNSSNSKGLVDDITYKVDKSNGVLQVKKNSKKIFTSSTIIKNTGYSITGFAILFSLCSVILIYCLVSVSKFKEVDDE